jgi:hypothetical protein
LTDATDGRPPRPWNPLFRTVSARLPELRALWASTPVARARDAFTLLVVIVFHTVLGVKFLRAPFGNFDEHYFVHEGWSVTKGLVPYRDIQEFKPPAIFFVNALGIKLFGVDQMGYRYIFSLLSLCGFLVIAVALLTRRVNRLFVVALLLFMIDHFFNTGFHDSSINNAESLSVDFFMMGAGILLMRTRWPRAQLFVGAALLAGAPLSKEPVVFATLLAWLTLLLFHRVEHPQPGATKRYLRLTIAGAATVGATWLLYMLVTHSFRSYLEQVRLNMMYAKNYAHQMHWLPEHPEGGFWGEAWRRFTLGYINAPQTGAFVPLFLAPFFLWDRARRIVAVGAFLTFAAGVYAISIGSGFAGHYFIMAMTGTFLWIFLGTLALDDATKKDETKQDGAKRAEATDPGRAISRWIGASWLALALYMFFPHFADEWKKYSAYKAPPPPINAAEVAFVRAHSAPNDKVWNLGDPLLNVYAERVSPFREQYTIDQAIDYYPGTTDEQRLAGQRAELLADRPKLIVFGQDNVPYQRRQRYIKALVMPFIHDAGYVKLGDKFYARP